MRVIRKYTLETSNLIQNITMPLDAKVKRFDFQSGQFCIWVLTDPQQKTEVQFYFLLIETDEYFVEGEYIDSCQDGMDTWHLIQKHPA